jgi:hypothetical protein
MNMAVGQTVCLNTHLEKPNLRDRRQLGLCQWNKLMKCITDTQCVEWLKTRDIDGAAANGRPKMVGDHELLFAAPKAARVQLFLARDLVTWVGGFERALFWVSDWPFYKPEEMAIALGLRRAHQEVRQFIEAPGHLFEFDECDELVGWVSLMMNFGWDGHLFAYPFRGNVFQTSHHDTMWATTTDIQQFRALREMIRQYDADVYRETQVAQ